MSYKGAVVLDTSIGNPSYRPGVFSASTDESQLGFRGLGRTIYKRNIDRWSYPNVVSGSTSHFKSCGPNAKRSGRSTHRLCGNARLRHARTMPVPRCVDLDLDTAAKKQRLSFSVYSGNSDCYLACTRPAFLREMKDERLAFYGDCCCYFEIVLILLRTINITRFKREQPMYSLDRLARWTIIVLDPLPYFYISHGIMCNRIPHPNHFSLGSNTCLPCQEDINLLVLSLTPICNQLAQPLSPVVTPRIPGRTNCLLSPFNTC
jgi:hypothetical protein